MTARQVKVAVAKESRDTFLGISLRQESDEDIFINTIASDSLFANTSLKPGMEVLKINGVAADCLSLAQIMKVLRNTEDVVTIEACDTGTREDRSSTCEVVEPTLRTSGGATNPENNVSSGTSSEPANPDNTPASSGPPPFLESNQEATLVVTSSTEDVAIAPTTAAPSDLEGMPVARAEIMDSTRSIITIDATPVVAASLLSLSPITPDDNGFTSSIATDVIDQNGTVTVTARKPTPEARTGLGLKTVAGAGAVITSFKTFCIFNGTNLKRGMQILEVNGQDCTNQTGEYVATLLNSCGADVTIVARDASIPSLEGPDRFPLVTALVNKPTRRSKIGIGVGSARIDNRSDVPVIGSIDPRGLSARTSLETGMQILCINGIACGGQQDTLAMLAAAQGVVRIMVGSMRLVAVTVTKKSIHTKVGLVMHKKQGITVVSNCPAGGLFYQTALKSGMRILQVNGKPVHGLRLDLILAMISSSQRTVTILAEKV